MCIYKELGSKPSYLHISMYYKVVFLSYVIYVLHIIDISNQGNCDMFCQKSYVETYIQPSDWPDT